MDMVLLGLGVLVIISAILTIESKELMHGAFFLGLLLVTVGELYILLGAEYVGIIQILVYGGGVTVLMLFAMLFIPRKRVKEYPASYRALGVIAVLLMVSLILTGIGLVSRGVLGGGIAKSGELAYLISNVYAVSVLVLGLLLFSVIVSASYIAGERREKI